MPNIEDELNFMISNYENKVKPSIFSNELFWR
jgi:hypothetical protein